MNDVNNSILRKPIITEKASMLREKNKFVVEVEPVVTKGQIRQEIETRYKVNVLSVKTLKQRGKFRRKMGPQGGYQPNRKKAIVQLKEGQQITWEEAK